MTDLLASLEEIADTPLDEITADRADEVVRRILGEPDVTTLDIAAFTSSI
jgi:hypothetical protein